MPIYERAYLRHDGPRTPRTARSVAIARAGVRNLLRRRAFLSILALAWVPAVVRATQIYVSHQFPGAADVFQVTEALWQDFLSQQIYFLPVLIVSLYAGASAIASDVESGALVLYLSKPISRFDYVLGKALPLLASLALVTVAPALSLLGLHLGLSGGPSLLSDAPGLPVSIVAYGSWTCLFFTLTVLAVSSLSSSGRVAGAGYAGLVLGSEVFVRGGLDRVLRDDPPPFASMMGAAVDSGNVFFASHEASSGAGSALVVLLGMLLSGAVLWRRLRSPEDGS